MQFARLFMIFGVVIFVIGGGFYLAARLNIPLGRLPGDIRIQRENFTCFFPLTTSIILSILLTIAFKLLNRFQN
ncbi:MAG: DUF2905 domain-containing protein [Chloroflexi bacterium]|nr:DUF2905 domain-containing protein [Chloroflexota bacterium]